MTYEVIATFGGENIGFVTSAEQFEGLHAMMDREGKKHHILNWSTEQNGGFLRLVECKGYQPNNARLNGSCMPGCGQPKLNCTTIGADNVERFIEGS